MTERMDTNVYVGGTLRKAVTRHPLQDTIDRMRGLLTRLETEIMDGDADPVTMAGVVNDIRNQAAYL